MVVVRVMGLMGAAEQMLFMAGFHDPLDELGENKRPQRVVAVPATPI
jgi:hypothetical protein